MELEGWVVYPTDDDSVSCVAKFGKDLGLTTWGVKRDQLDVAVDKRNTPLLAQELGLRAPNTVPFSDLQEGRGVSFPAIIKPRVKEPFFRITRKKAVRVNSLSELHATVDSLSAQIPRDDLLVQELIPGNGLCQLSYAALFWEGRPVAELTACRKRQHPMDFGRASTFVFTISDEEVRQAGRRVLTFLGYTGLAEVEFKRHASTGLLYFLEINPRTWGWHRLVHAAHGNWIAALQRILCGEQPRLHQDPTQASWVKLITDLPIVSQGLWRRDLTLRELLHDYRQTPMAFGTWDKSDPLPFIAELVLLPYLAFKRGY